jgi:hypothetical protein
MHSRPLHPSTHNTARTSDPTDDCEWTPDWRACDFHHAQRP